MGFDVRRLDVYRKVPKDLTQPTLTGALISVLCCLAILVLLVSELFRFLETDLVSEVYVDNPGADDSRVPVSITVELPNLKCEFIGLDIQDDMGRHDVGFVENTEKVPLGDDGKGCNFHATFQINKVPGNFHVSTHSAKTQPDNPDFTHRIVEVRFGGKIVAKNVIGSFNPLAGVQKSTDFGIESHDYIMKVVPTIYEKYSGETTISYQYTYAYRSFVGRGMPALWFRYDLSPLTVRYKEKGEPIFSFLTAVCAVVGGVFTVAGIIDGLVFSASEIYKKLEIGKLS